MARNPTDQAIEEQFRDQFEALIAEQGYGYTLADLPDEDHHKFANEVLRRNLGPLYQKAQAQDGLTIAQDAVPVEWAARLGAVDPADVIDFAKANYDGPRGTNPVKAFGADLAKFKKNQTDAEFRERYGDPNADSGRR